ncbi:MAG: ATP-dependent Clp protease adapter ClpS [Arthrobacter sp.]|uniref:ATP-dependent Clp protease adapter ClpS n=1 Tax=unclassified Arthrobacter TaxID=235627 RepID=UPI00265216D1|nr:ATP-dependent Clp protease adapter ClpS [Micrococcaceae bacterium]MDN5811893.1 ATP-dependent Clp protease adapter ClpS [Micrococcaceae bacterium]MDN5823863.1 ATP-dependent Clp protease adapter ClpS [Micrococcaceae bacterium]MDN5878545.1 ATP-dependent Clp protease adapter ClpS [Micrococcaceae bacterium]MDN5886386.1 ATP-dependent Clp protease adapter ClpS [Micrococcaceae bacterium]
MPVLTAPTDVLPRSETTEQQELDTPYVLLVWNDPVNLMSYVSYVFRSHFGYSETKADQLMLEVHQQGRSVVSTGALEQVEADVAAMHGYGLWATFQRADQG